MYILDDFAKTIKKFRKEAKISQKQLASIMEVSEAQYQNYEYGKHIPTIDKIIKICKHFNVSADYLLGLSDNPEVNK